MMCDNPKLAFVNMNAYIKFGENQSTYSRDIEQKQNFRVNQHIKIMKKFDFIKFFMILSGNKSIFLKNMS